MKVQYPVLVIKSGIDDDTLESIIKQIGTKHGEKLYMVIDTYGGDPSIGYRIMRMLQQQYDLIIAIIPDVAFSTGTLMALGADIIYMHPAASLGPLDTQIQHPTDGGQISSLEIRENLNTLSGSALSYATSYYVRLRNKMQIGKVHASKVAFDAAIKVITPIAEKIDPIYLQMSMRTSRVGQSYASKLLKARMLKDYPVVADKVSHLLANSYDYHGYAIMLDEAQDELLLTAYSLTNLAEWEGGIKKQYEDSYVNAVQVYIDDETDEDATEATPAPETTAPVVQDDGQQKNKKVTKSKKNSAKSQPARAKIKTGRKASK
jgi:hypothetical protein